jgi:hypothetical protein
MLSSPLASLSTKELQLRFQEAFGQATPSRNRPWLLKRLAATPTPAAPNQEVSQAAVAPLPAAESATSTDAEVSPPAAPVVPATEAGAPSPTAEPATSSDVDMPPPPAPAAPTSPTDPLAPQVGTEIRRTWRGQEVVVSVQADGFHLNGAVYRSLSAAATALCGGNRNGLVFFGLKPRPVRARAATAALDPT